MEELAKAPARFTTGLGLWDSATYSPMDGHLYCMGINPTIKWIRRNFSKLHQGSFELLRMKLAILCKRLLNPTESVDEEYAYFGSNCQSNHSFTCNIFTLVLELPKIT